MYIALMTLAGLVGLAIVLYATRRSRAITRGFREQEECLREEAHYVARMLGWLETPEKHRGTAPTPKPALPDLYTLGHRHLPPASSELLLSPVD